MTEKENEDANKAEPLWSGRFSEGPAPEARALGHSLAFDVRLAPQDVAAGKAHLRALQDAGVLTGDERATLEQALAEVGRRIAEGTFAFEDADEDVHSAIERGVARALGDLGGKLHAGRSRNDLVVTDLRLWLLEAGRRIDGLTTMLVRSLVRRAREHAETLMPGTTHARAAH
jgi:argininosuccinate lyase